MKEKEDNKVAMVEDDEITLKEVILKLQEYLDEIWRNWKIVILVPIPFAIFMLYQVINIPIVYPANLTFMVNEDDSGSIGGMGAILGQFGLGGNSGGKFNLDKILELASSRKIIQQVLFEKKELNGELNYIANHLIKVYRFHEKWEKGDNEENKGFLFKHDNVKEFRGIEKAVLKSLYGLIIAGGNSEGLLKTSYGLKTGIMKISTKTESELLSILLAEVVYDKLGTYYIEKTIEKQKRTYEIVENKVDSIKQLMDHKEFALANFIDSSRGLYTKKAKLKEVQLNREATILSLLYTESLRNLEIADFSLKTKTPFIQQIDAPIAPLSSIGKSKIRAILIGGILGGFIAVTFILGRKIFIDAMKE